MRNNLKSILGLAFLLFFGHLAASSQYTNSGGLSPEALLAESKALEDKAKSALNDAALYQKEGSLFLDSARFISNVLRNNPKNENISFFVNQFEAHYMFAYRYIAMADSMTILAENFREESINKTKEAFAMMGKDVQVSYSRSDNPIQAISIPNSTSVYNASSSPISLPIVKNTSGNSPNLASNIVTTSSQNEILTQQELIYIVQLGAGNMDMNYFKKVLDIKTINCKDGIKRYVLPVAFSKSDANKKKMELMNQGYQQIFIRTKESLDKISN